LYWELQSVSHLVEHVLQPQYCSSSYYSSGDDVETDSTVQDDPLHESWSRPQRLLELKKTTWPNLWKAGHQHDLRKWASHCAAVGIGSRQYQKWFMRWILLKLVIEHPCSASEAFSGPE
jgi:hypothetical protein